MYSSDNVYHVMGLDSLGQQELQILCSDLDVLLAWYAEVLNVHNLLRSASMLHSIIRPRILKSGQIRDFFKIYGEVIFQ